MKIRFFVCCILLLTLFTTLAQGQTIIKGIWPAEKANAWYARHKWINGANFTPSTAINQLEMWQADSFDPVTIDRELGWAESIGFNTMRVFLHSLAWKQDPQGFKQRVGRYLTIASKHHIQTIFVFLDDCWNADPKPGKQSDPKPGIHNSGWVQDPGIAVRNPDELDILNNYITDMLGSFKHDKRILLWDMFNEPNIDRGDTTLMLLTKAIGWARAVNPDQPLSAGYWDAGQKGLNEFQLANSDVITYHCYDVPDKHLALVKKLKAYGRPLICTEYMARPFNSTFESIMPMLKNENVGAINWGFVSGKTNTKYAWGTPMPDGGEPKLWFHDVLRPNGEPYKKAETDLIKQLNNK